VRAKELEGFRHAGHARGCRPDLRREVPESVAHCSSAHATTRSPQRKPGKTTDPKNAASRGWGVRVGSGQRVDEEEEGEARAGEREPEETKKSGDSALSAAQGWPGLASVVSGERERERGTDTGSV